jgi:hypothetical protein
VAIEYFVGSTRGGWALGKRRYESRQMAEAIAAADFRWECANLGGVYLRRVVLA